MLKVQNLKPILKWVGGKRQLLHEIMPLIPDNISVYVEPFVGGGAVLFEYQPKRAIINDYNEELMNVYKVIKESPDELIKILITHKENNSKKYFYTIRAVDREEDYMEKFSNVERAARTIFLNKTCYNGLYRVNSKGQFNTPYGRYKNPNIVDEQLIYAISEYFNKNDITIMNSDYRDALKNLNKDSFVYFDPPYLPISDSSSFTSYTQNGFTLEQQIELKEQCDILHQNGIKFLLSNSDHPFIRDLYKDYHIKTVHAKRAINSKANKRGEIKEVLVYNYEEPINE